MGCKLSHSLRLNFLSSKNRQLQLRNHIPRSLSKSCLNYGWILNPLRLLRPHHQSHRPGRPASGRPGARATHWGGAARADAGSPPPCALAKGRRVAPSTQSVQTEATFSLGRKESGSPGLLSSGLRCPSGTLGGGGTVCRAHPLHPPAFLGFLG